MSAGGSKLEIRRAQPGDEQVLHALIAELAEFERLSHEHVGSVADINKHLFGEDPVARALLALEADEPVGFALYFRTFSTFLGRPGYYLEDLYVRPASRGQGVGTQLLRQIAAECVAERGGRLEWAVLNWNSDAIAFYQSLGAEPMDEWTVYRLSGPALKRFGEGGA